MYKKTLIVLLLSAIFLSLTSSAQDPKVEKKKKKQLEKQHIVIDTVSSTKYTFEPDSLYIEQKAINAKLDSLLNEKKKK